MFIEADTHCHTVASTHGYSTIMEIATCAAERGLKAVAITDHTPGNTDAPHIWHFHNLKKAIPRKIKGVSIIYGAESSIIDYEGNIDFPENECAALDWIIASIHRDMLKAGTVEQITNTYLKVAENPLVDVIGHPGTLAYPFDYEQCIAKFKECGKLVEINESSIKWKGTADNFRKIAEICKKMECPIVVNSDGHYCELTGEVPLSKKMLEDIDFPERLILNADWDRLRRFINGKRGRELV